MPKIAYQGQKFDKWKIDLIDHVNRIVTDYKRQGYNLTLRQVYYQFVANDLLPERWADPATGSVNNQRSYKNLGEIINSGRLSGLIDWSSIEDRTRSLSTNNHFESPADRIEWSSKLYALDKWEDQPYRVEVWVEKDALEGVIARPCKELDISYFSCRGYTSQTSMWDAGQRIKDYIENGQRVLLLHLGDHDPSGIDMSRDIEERLQLFIGEDEAYGLEFRRIALNMAQVNQYTPPPNPAKITDSRAKGYIATHGEESWELDALEPRVMYNLIKDNVLSVRDEDKYEQVLEREKEDKKLLNKTGNYWNEVVEFLNNIKE